MRARERERERERERAPQNQHHTACAYQAEPLTIRSHINQAGCMKKKGPLVNSAEGPSVSSSPSPAASALHGHRRLAC